MIKLLLHSDAASFAYLDQFMFQDINKDALRGNAKALPDEAVKAVENAK